jgi:adenine-specific DNA-methyltransferase
MKNEDKMKKLTAADPETKSLDLIADNLKRLKALFPELVTEGPEGLVVDVDVLKALIGDKTVTDAGEKYGLNWHGKRRARQLALTPSIGTLRPCPEDSVDWDTTQNLMIEGDNLEVLKLLQKSYAGKVRLIYIDPPYNTGKDFVYPDDFKDNIRNYLELTGQVDGGRIASSNTEASGRYHTNWLNMIYPRLKLARALLRNDGALFVSIDDGEVERLRAICSEVFGEENFVAQIAWQNLDTVKNDARYFSINHEYIVCYAKQIDELKVAGLKKTEKQRAYYTNRDNDPRGDYLLTPLHAKSGSESGKYSYTFANGQLWTAPPGTFPRFSRETLAALEADNRIYLKPDGSGVPQRKTFWSEVGDRMPPSTFWDYETYGSTRLSNAEVAELVGKGVFQNPKPTKTIAALIELLEGQSGIIMDFFAGSGTTGHAVMTQNAVDGGDRRYLLVQLPEPLDSGNKDQKVAADFCDTLSKPRTIAELTKERLRRAAKKIKAENPMFAGDLGFRVFKLDSSNFRTWEPDRDNLDQTLLDYAEHLKEGRSEQDILYELLLKLGLDLCIPIETKTIAGKAVHSIGGGVLLACLATRITRDDVEPLAQGIVAWHKALSPTGTTCRFRDSAFVDDVAKTNLAAILNQHGLIAVQSL